MNDWINTTNIYEVNLRQYTTEGTFNAFANHLPRLADMGVQTLWFMPVTPIAQRNKKGTMGSYYASSDFTSVNPEFGTLQDFVNLVQQAHEMGFRVILDWVANHTGWDHVWTQQHPDWYKKDEYTGEFKRASGMDDIIELDFGNSAMCDAMIAAMQFWIDTCDIDGFRCDLAFWVELDFWKMAKQRLRSNRELFWLAEADPLDSPEYLLVFDAAYTWKWMHCAESFYQKKLPFSGLLQVLDEYYLAPGIKAWFTSNHDENTWNGTEYDKYGEAARMLAVFSCTWAGIPLIYSGQEIPNFKRLQFFEKDAIDWGESCHLHLFYRTLLHLRAAHPALNAKAKLLRIHSSADEKALIFLRKNDDAAIVVLLNFSDMDCNVEIFDHRIEGVFKDVFSAGVINFDVQRRFHLKKWGWMVLEKQA